MATFKGHLSVDTNLEHSFFYSTANGVLVFGSSLDLGFGLSGSLGWPVP